MAIEQGTTNRTVSRQHQHRTRQQQEVGVFYHYHLCAERQVVEQYWKVNLLKNCLDLGKPVSKSHGRRGLRGGGSITLLAAAALPHLLLLIRLLRLHVVGQDAGKVPSADPIHLLRAESHAHHPWNEVARDVLQSEPSSSYQLHLVLEAVRQNYLLSIACIGLVTPTSVLVRLSYP